MTDSSDKPTTDGSTDISEEQKKQNDSLADGSPSGDATKDPDQESDTTSGGDPE